MMILRAVYSHNYGENRLVGTKQDVEEELQVDWLFFYPTFKFCDNDDESYGDYDGDFDDFDDFCPVHEGLTGGDYGVVDAGTFHGRGGDQKR